MLVLLILFSLGSSSFSLSASDTTFKWWASEGIVADNWRHYGFDLNISLLKGKHGVSTEYYTNFIPWGFTSAHFVPNRMPNRADYIKSLSIQYAYCLRHPTYIIVANTGISYNLIRWRGEQIGVENHSDASNYVNLFSYDTPIFDSSSSYHFGIPIATQVILATEHIGLGFKIYANFHKHTDYGVMLHFMFGKFK